MSEICLLLFLFLFSLSDMRGHCIPVWGAGLFWLLGALLYGFLWRDRGWAPLLDGAAVLLLCVAARKVFPDDIGAGDVILLTGLFLYVSGQTLWTGLCISFLFNGLGALGVWIIHRDKKAVIPYIPFLWIGFLVTIATGV